MENNVYQNYDPVDTPPRSAYIKELVLYGVFFLVFLAFFIAIESGIGMEWYIILLQAYMFGAIAAGWKTLTRITPRTFLFLPIIGWLIYFGVKAFISLMIGWVALPIRVTNAIKHLRQ